ncbi:MAG: beta-ketoacyl synthase N-terminal-like domain-containing protein [Phycisphaerae bacterium]
MNPDPSDVVVTGVGPVTCTGVGREAFWASLVQSRSNVQTRALQVDLGRFAELPIAAMPAEADVLGLDVHTAFLNGQECEGYRDLGYALLAIELALADAGLEYDRDKNTIGAIQVFEAPGVERTVSRLFQLLTEPMPTDGPPQVYELLAPYFYAMQPFLYVHLVGKAFGLRGYSTSIHNACSSGAFAIEVAAQRIRSGEADAMIVVGGEAFDTAVRLEWFRRLELYAQTTRMCPFDTESSGFYVGEGAGAIILESATHAARRGVSPYARYLGGAFTHQGWKQVIPDVRSARLRDVIVEAMANTGLAASELDLIVPHGASTQLGDGYEALCLTEAIKGQGGNAIATAFKPYVGHMLAASGIIEAICALLAIKHQSVPATLNTQPDHMQLPVPLATSPVERPVRTVLKLSTGFTGHDAASIFRAV